MPVEEESPGHFRWGKHGKVYGSRAKALAQARAAYANGYREDRQVRKAVRALRPPRRAENKYSLALAGIMGAVHQGVMHVVEREHLGALHQDSAVPAIRQANEYSCGPAAVLSILRARAPDRFNGLSEEQLYPDLGTVAKTGTEPGPMADVLRRELGVRVDVRWPVELNDLDVALDRGELVILAIQAWPGKPPADWGNHYDDGHYVVLTARRRSPDSDGALRVMDPYTGDHRWMSSADLLEKWHYILGDGFRVQHLAIFVASDGSRQDAAKPPVGLSDRLLHKIVRFQTPKIEAAYDDMADEVGEHGAEQMYMLGIAPRAIAGLDSVIEHSRAENVKLITKASSDMLSRVRDILDENEGERPETIRDKLAQLDGIGKRRAMLIARTETSKLNSQLVQHRARAAGLKKYRWSGSLDERERPTHRELEGQVFSWDDPPESEENGDRNHPGEAPNCRCVPLPYIEELEEGVGEGEEEPETLEAEREAEEPEEEEEEPDEEEEGEEAADAADALNLKPPPRRHLVGMPVPTGGSSCSKCMFLVGERECGQAGWVNAPKDRGGGGGDPRLPKPSDQFCCDFYDWTKRTEDAGEWEEGKHQRVPKGQPGGGRFGSGSASSTAAAPPAPAPSGITRAHFASVTTPETHKERIREELRDLDKDLASGEVTPERYVGMRKVLDDELAAHNAATEARLSPEQVIAGLHHEGMTRWMSKPENQPDLEIRPYIGGDTKTGGQYHSAVPPDRDRGKIIVATNNLDLVRPPDAQPLGQSWGVDTAAIHGTYANGAPVRPTANARIQSNFLHELGHHVHMSDEFTILRAQRAAQEKAQAEGKPLTSFERPRSDFEMVDKTIERAYDSHGFDHVGASGQTYRERVLRGDAEANPVVSRYAATNHQEYFAETFAAYMANPDAVRAHDQVGYDMVKRVLKIRGIE